MPLYLLCSNKENPIKSRAQSYKIFLKQSDRQECSNQAQSRLSYTAIFVYRIQANVIDKF